ncbi:MAG: hypothetical protein RL094_126 [Candidatus Parcubacteria bacterium]|jgi:hypothetical protein
MKQDTVLVKKISLYVLLLSVVSLLTIPTILKAQTVQDDISLPAVFGEIKEQISIDIYPEIPKPFEDVTITAEAYGTDLNRATVIWSYNGKIALRGTGEKVFKFKVGAVGSTNNVELRITPVSGPEIVKTFSFTPAEVDILWQAKTYVPPFYKGKALYTPEAEVTFMAQPNIIEGGKNLSSDKAVYTWKVDRRVQGDKSGFGKNTFQHTGSIIIKPHLFQAEAYSQTNNKNKGIGGVTLEETDPQTALYENHPLYGMLFNKAITGTYFLYKSEAQMGVFPYYFSTTNKNSFVNYAWRLNELPIQAPSYETLMTFRKNEGQSGVADVSVALSSSEKILQASQANFSIFFGN